MSLFKIYSSSAGSGKTFTLTKEYLKLILAEEDPTYFRKVLAITFTNDAAQEMKSRILGSLKSFSKNEDSNMLKELLSEKPDITREKLIYRSKNVFSELIHNYSDFAVKTIDSFINQVVSAFTFDLNLPHNFEIRLDADIVIAEATEILIDKINKEGYEELSTIFQLLSFSELDAGKSINRLTEKINEIAKNLLNDESFNQINKNNGLLTTDYQKIRLQIKKYLNDIESEIKLIAEKGIKLILENGLSVEDFSRKGTGIYGFYDRLISSPRLILEEEGFPNSYHKKAIENNEWYTKTANSSVKSTIDGISEQLREIAIHIINIRDQEISKFTILNTIYSNISQYPFFGFLDKGIRELLESRNEVFLSDFNRHILNIVVQEPVPFIYERIGEKYNHFLVDEFQDTSSIQFFNLLPLIDNAIANDKFNMLVGDPKQSIYQWRGGNIHLMIDLIKKDATNLKLNKETSEIQFEQIDNIIRASKAETLGFNYRSAKEIIEFNNSFFEHFVDVFGSEFPLIQDVFLDINQEVPATAAEGGCVEITFYNKKEEPSILERLEYQIKNLLTEGWKPSDIAILFRRKKEAKEVSTFLKAKGFEVFSSDSLLLKYCNEVSFIVSALKVFQYPDEKFYKFEMLEFLRKIRTESDFSLILNPFADSEKVPNETFFDSFNNYGINLPFEKLIKADFFHQVDILISVFDLLKVKNSQDFVLAFQDISLDFLKKKSTLLIDFLIYWESEKEKAAIQSESHNAIIINTIHKAKGLEYPIVIIPFADWDTGPHRSSSVWLDVEHLGFDELSKANQKLNTAMFPLSNKKFKNTQFAESINSEVELVYVEAINTLYVALTRAVNRLYLFSGVDYNKSGIKYYGIGQYLYDYVTSKAIFSEDNIKFIVKNGKAVAKKDVIVEEENLLIIERPSSYIHSTPVSFKKDATYKSLDESQKIEMGNLVHAVFEKIRYIEDVPSAILELENSGLVLNSELEVLKSNILEIVNHPNLAFLFDNKNEVRNEVEILADGMSAQRPDRVVFVEEKVYIIDYKTGEKSDKHQEQLAKYGRLFNEMGYLDVQLKLVYLMPLEIFKL